MLQLVKSIISKLLSRKRAIVIAVGKKLNKYYIYIHKNAVTLATIFICTVLSVLILYMLFAPLGGLTASDFSSEYPQDQTVSWARSLKDLDTYLQPLKFRDLFKPSVPIPVKKGIGKTTADQLSERLSFLGTSGDETNLSALISIADRGPGMFKTGDRVAEFVLKKIDKNSIVLQLENEQITLKR